MISQDYTVIDLEMTAAFFRVIGQNVLMKTAFKP